MTSSRGLRELTKATASGGGRLLFVIAYIVADIDVVLVALVTPFSHARNQPTRKSEASPVIQYVLAAGGMHHARPAPPHRTHTPALRFQRRRSRQIRRASIREGTNVVLRRRGQAGSRDRGAAPSAEQDAENQKQLDAESRR